MFCVLRHACAEYRDCKNMRILIIRHGDPDYSIDSLTEKGFREAYLLADRLEHEQIDDIYCSIYGRAKDTAAETLRRKNMTATYCDWLREIDYMNCGDPQNPGAQRHIWDFLPRDFCPQEDLYQKDGWKESDWIKNTDVPRHYDNVCAELDKVLAKHGYIRSGNMYKAEQGNHDTIAFFCHFGCESILLSHLLNTSPFVFLQNFCALTTSVTTIYTEERIKGEVSLRCAGFGDISHLYKGGEQASFAARFCECFEDDTRHI